MHIEPSPRRYSASAAVSPPGSQTNLQVPPIFNLIPPSPQEHITRESLKKLTDQQWHIPILLHGCNKNLLASSLLLSNEQLLKTLTIDHYVDCAKDDNDTTNTSTAKPTVPSVVQNLKPRKRGRKFNLKRKKEVFDSKF